MAVGRVASWWRRTFTFEHDRIVVDEGILQRTQRVVPYDRIQQVDLRSDIRHRVLGAASVRIDVAGGAAARACASTCCPSALARSLQAVRAWRGATTSSRPTARGTRRGGARRDAARALQPAAARWPGLMSDAVGVAFAGAAGLLGFVWQLGLVTPEDVADQASSETHVVAAVVALVAARRRSRRPWRGSTATARYRLWPTATACICAHGLVETRRITVPRRRVQVVTVRENIVGRRLGLVSIVVASATTAGDRSRADRPARAHPAARASSTTSWSSLMGDPAWRPPALQPRPRAALRRAVVRRTVPLLAVVGAVAFLTPWSLLASPAAIALGVVWGRRGASPRRPRRNGAPQRPGGGRRAAPPAPGAARPPAERARVVVAVPAPRRRSRRCTSTSPVARTRRTCSTSTAPTAQRLALALPRQGVRV